MRDVTVRGVRTRAVEVGSPDGPALLLVHGFLTSHHEWDDVIDAFGERFRVIALDLPGFGASEKPSPARYAYGVEAFAESLADIMAAFRVGRASIVGHGIGGAVALTLAAEHAELVHRLVLVDPLCYPFPLGFTARAVLFPILGSIAFKQLYTRRMFRAHFRNHVFSADAVLPHARIDQHYETFNTPAARESAHAVLRSTLDTRPVVASLGRITVPSLVVWGHDDRVFPAAPAQRLARELGGARVAIMDTGHSPHEERPDEFVSIVTRFIERKR